MDLLASAVELNWVDYVSLSVVALGLVYGAVRGFLLQLAGIVVLVLAILAGAALMNPLGRWLGGVFGALSETAARTICFLIVLLVALAVGTALAHLLRGGLDKAKALAYDRLLGGLLGVLKAGLLLVVLIQAYLNLAAPEVEAPTGIARDLIRSETGRVARWSSEKILLFLPRELGEKLRRHDRLNTPAEGS